MPSRRIVKHKSKKLGKEAGRVKSKPPFVKITQPPKNGHHSDEEEQAQEEEVEVAEEDERIIEHRDDVVIRDKDDTEKQLEKLLFGDDQGFHEALRDRPELTTILQQNGDDHEMADRDGEQKEDRGDEDDDITLEDVPDSEVRMLTSCSCL